MILKEMLSDPVLQYYSSQTGLAVFPQYYDVHISIEGVSTHMTISRHSSNLRYSIYHVLYLIFI